METESDDRLVRYVLGELAAGEAERLDERSITDAGFALRLRTLENDLVDQYARGTLAASLRERFDRACRASPHLREKTQFAAALRDVTRPAPSDRHPIETDRTHSRPRVRGLAAAAVVLLAVAGYMSVRNARLRDEVSRLEAARQAIQQENADLQRRLESAAGLASSLPTFVLRPPRRGPGGDSAVISVPDRTTEVTLRLVVESDDYAMFSVAIRDPSTSRVLWRSPDLSAEPDTNGQGVTVAVPARLLENRRYIVELFAVATGGQAELIGQYPVRVVLQ